MTVAHRPTEPASAPSGARARVRAELTREITHVARAHLARDGAAGLSLRAVSRDLGMSSSAVYRYFPSRDALLTALIIEAHDSLGDAVEQADAIFERSTPEAYALRVRSAFLTVRQWALGHPHEWGLIYGAPVPGYAAPQDTIAPATRVSLVVVPLIFAAARAGELVDSPVTLIDGSTVRARIAEANGAEGLEALPEGLDLFATAVAVRAAVFGLVSFELNGQHHQVLGDAEAFFAGAVDTFMATLGFRDGA